MNLLGGGNQSNSYGNAYRKSKMRAMNNRHKERHNQTVVKDGRIREDITNRTKNVCCALNKGIFETNEISKNIKIKVVRD